VIKITSFSFYHVKSKFRKRKDVLSFLNDVFEPYSFRHTIFTAIDFKKGKRQIAEHSGVYLEGFKLKETDNGILVKIPKNVAEDVEDKFYTTQNKYGILWEEISH